MTRDEFDRRAKDAGLQLTADDCDGMFALFSGFESLKERVRPAVRSVSAEPALVFSPSRKYA
jgi:hypothetical protein